MTGGFNQCVRSERLLYAAYLSLPAGFIFCRVWRRNCLKSSLNLLPFIAAHPDFPVSDIGARPMDKGWDGRN